MTSEMIMQSWSALRQNGMLISPAVLDGFLPATVPPIAPQQYDRLRDAATAFRTWEQSARPDDVTGLYRWLDTVLEDLLGYPRERWQKHTGISERFKVPASRRGGPALSPDRVLLSSDSSKGSLLLKIDHTSKRVGLGRGRQVYANFLELLRGTNSSLGILTNGHQFRLVFAGIDYDCWVEWEADHWFEDDAGVLELAIFRLVCGSYATEPRDDLEYPLLSAVQESRTRQGELSQVLGEQTRRAVEVLLKSLNSSIKSHPDLVEILRKNPETGAEISEEDQNKALYQATIRLVMRLVVSLFAEARGLLPNGTGAYYYSYSIEGLFSQLKQASVDEGHEALEGQNQAWHRLLGLFRLIYEGSDAQDLPVPSYGGGLFRRGDARSPDAVIRALSLYENERVQISDRVVYDILTLLKIGRVRAKSGRNVRIISGVVDFSDLRTEYIGMMYEGLLDYQLRKVMPEEEAIIFLNLGIQPVLPFSLLKGLNDSQLKDLIQKLNKEKAEKKVETEGEEGTEEEEEPAVEEDVEAREEAREEAAEEEVPGEEPAGVPDKSAEDERIREILDWAVNAVKVAGLVPKPRGRNPNLFQYEKDVERRAQTLIQPQEICYPGDLYLVRSTGTRKGSGTFYTKPQLAVPTVHRTLEPLVYNVEGEGEKRKLTPKTPEAILSLKVCDPGMGSGSFLVAALRYLTDALFESLWYHQRIKSRNSESAVITLPFGAVAKGEAFEEILPCSVDDERFEPMMKARLKRYIVERCIYGVDINPLAVELGKLALWVETMDRELPFEFLDHKLKVGNSLVGCWFDQFQEYPVMAWRREGGDKGHKGVHFEESTWTKAIKTVLDERVKTELKKVIQQQTTLDSSISDETTLKELFALAVRRFERIHAMAITDYEGREAFFKDCILADPDLARLKERFDLWCAIWFWHGEWMDDEAPTPDRFYHPTDTIWQRVAALVEDLKFFHWELEFADVFVAGKGGFDAVVGNPPWEISKPKSQEFFSLYDPIYRMRGKQEALIEQKNLFTKDVAIERAWLLYSAYFKAMSNWNKNVAFPFGDPSDEPSGGTSCSLTRGRENNDLHSSWRKRRGKHLGFADIAHPFQHQGSADINTYKMFLETAHALCRNGGRFGFIVPSGVYTDKGSTELRDLFINRCKWNWIWSFINWNKLFPAIYYRFKFATIVVEKGITGNVIHCGFNKKTFESWENAEREKLSIQSAVISRFSPKSKAILETSTQKDLDIIEKIYGHSVLVGDQLMQGWEIQYASEFHMTGDSKLFPPKNWWEEKGYRPDSYGRWLPPEGRKPELSHRGERIGPNGDIALPLYEGRMIGQFDFCEKGYVSGRGRSAVWREIPWVLKVIEPQFLMAEKTYREFGSEYGGLKLCFMAIGSATNMRSMISSLVPDKPCGNAVPILKPTNIPEVSSAMFCALLNSISYDYALRCRLGGINLNYFVIEETPIISPKISLKIQNILIFSFRLNCANQIFAQYWLIFKSVNKKISKSFWKSLWAITPHERLRLRCNLDALIAELYGLSWDDFAWILRDCAHPLSHINQIYHSLDPKGFWRVDKDKDPELRHTVLALKAFADLKSMGIDAFCALNDGEGWMIPETLTYAVNPDGTIAFDTPDGKTVLVQERLGERFLEWQRAGTPEESWKECEMHARNILGDEEFERMMAEIESSGGYQNGEERIGVAEWVIGGKGATAVPGVAEVMKKAEKKKKEMEENGKGQRNLEEW